MQVPTQMDKESRLSLAWSTPHRLVDTSNPLRILVPRSVLLDVLIAIVIGLVLSVSFAFLLFDLAAIQVAMHQERNAEHQQPPSDPRSSVSSARCSGCDCYWSGWSGSLGLSCFLVV